MPQRGHQSSPGQPYKLVTGKPQAYDTKARLGAMMDGEASYLPSEDFNLAEGPNQDNNGRLTRNSAPPDPGPAISKPKSSPNGGIGGPLE